MIEAIGLTSRRGGAAVLRDVSFEVVPGQVTGLVTPDGVTDSLVLRLMVQLARGGGRTLFNGRAYRELPDPMREVGVLLRPDAGRRNHTARDHVQLAAAVGGLSDNRVDLVLDLVGLTRAADRPLREFTPGMSRRLGVAVAVLGDPHALLLRDPVRGLESRGRDWICDFLRAYAAQGRAVLVTSTQAATMTTLADRLIHIDDGSIIADGPIRQADRKRRVRALADTVLVTSPSIERLAAVLTDAGCYVMRRGIASLEVRGLPRARVGQLAYAYQVPLDELTTLPRAQRERAARNDMGRGGATSLTDDAPTNSDAEAPTAEHFFDFSAFDAAPIRYESDAMAEPRARRVLDRIMINRLVNSLFDLTTSHTNGHAKPAPPRARTMPPPGTATQYLALDDTQEFPAVMAEPPEPRTPHASMEIPIVPVVPPASAQAMADTPARTR